MEKQDFPEVVRIFIATFCSPEFGEHWTKKTALEHIEENYHPDYSFVARGGSKIVGILVAQPMGGEHGQELFIDTFVVEKEKRGRGIGKQLWEKAVSSARTTSLAGISLLASPKHRSYKWYGKQGFEDTGWVLLHKYFKKS